MTTTTVTVGRKDYGWGIEATETTIEGHHFLVDANGRVMVPCGDCDRGHSGTKAHFAHVLEAVCFRCGGKGVSKIVGSVEDATRLAKRRNADEARRVRKAAEKAAEQQAERDVWAAAHPDLAARLLVVCDETGGESPDSFDAAKSYGDFIYQMAHRSAFAALTEAQTEAVAAALAKHDVRATAAAEKAAAQRHYGTKGAKVTATGTVATSINVDGYAYGTTDRLVVIEGTGDFEGVTFKATGSGATLFATERGDAVEFTATIKDHREYNGVPQTVVTRAKIKVLASA